ncbi:MULTISPECIES: hypothetical protein [Streptomyces]|uniref:Integral membrane protein n=1 Tax=Streptomyces flaveolus TaxID=67297 RepID=A0ABV3AJN0_9ACTN|nr:MULTISPECIES: hypothetical protein [Streptomyces]MBG7702439.1 hypothetical protein [Streptomyces sp. MC1]
MFRMVRLEAKRSLALPLLLVLAALTRVVLWMDVQQWAASWPALVHSARGAAWLVLPVAFAAAIWHGGRERRADVRELFAATPRPVPVRLTPAFLVITGTVAAAPAAVTAWAVVLVTGHATYDDGQWPLGLAVGLLATVAVTLLGLGTGRVVAAPVAAPLGAVLLFLILTVSQERDGRQSHPLIDTVLPTLPVTDDFHRVLPSLSAAQGIWFTALGVTGVLLAVAAGPRDRLLALAPAVAGAAVGTLLAPSGAVVPAPQATALVCAPADHRICVTKVHARTLPDLVAPARKVLDAYAKVPDGPRRVQEDPVSSTLDDRTPGDPAKHPGTVRVELPYRTREGGIRWDDTTLLALVAQTATVDLSCATTERQLTRAGDASDAITALLLGTTTDGLSPAARRAYDTLRALPPHMRYQRIGEARKAGLSCADPLSVITGQGAGR